MSDVAWAVVQLMANKNVVLGVIDARTDVRLAARNEHGASVMAHGSRRSRSRGSLSEMPDG